MQQGCKEAVLGGATGVLYGWGQAKGGLSPPPINGRLTAEPLGQMRLGITQAALMQETISSAL